MQLVWTFITKILHIYFSYRYGLLVGITIIFFKYTAHLFIRISDE